MLIELPFFKHFPTFGHSCCVESALKLRHQVDPHATHIKEHLQLFFIELGECLHPEQDHWILYNIRSVRFRLFFSWKKRHVIMVSSQTYFGRISPWLFESYQWTLSGKSPGAQQPYETLVGVDAPGQNGL